MALVRGCPLTLVAAIEAWMLDRYVSPSYTPVAIIERNIRQAKDGIADRNTRLDVITGRRRETEAMR
jgi:hypothetical protein